EEALVASVDDPGHVAPALERPVDLGMDGPAGGPVPDQLDAPELAGEHGVVEASQLVRRLALDHRAGHVGVVPTRRGAREDVEDYPLVGPDGPGALVVGIHALVAAGDDRVLGDAVVLHEGDVDRLLEVLGGERPPLVEHLVAPDHALAQHLERGFERGLGVPLRLLDGRHLVRGLHHPLGQEWARPRRHGDPPLPQPVGQLEREVARHLDRLRPVVLEQKAHDVGELGRGPPLPRLGVPFREREDLVYPRLGARAVHLEVGHQQDLASVHLQEDEGGRRQETAGVVEVRVGLAGRDDQGRGGIAHATTPFGHYVITRGHHEAASTGFCSCAMKRATTGVSRRPRRWMIPTGRTSPGRASGVTASVRIPDSLCTVGRGRMLTPALMPIACLIVSTLSNSITTSTLTSCCLSARSIALRTARSRSKATNFSPCRSPGVTERRRARRWAGWATSTMGSSRRGRTVRAREAAGYDRMPRSASSLRTASTTLWGCRHSSSTRACG